MKRFHVHVHVADLDQSVGFYTRLFGLPPARQESDYAKWMLDDPPVNFAVSQRGGQPGVDHLGIQVDDPAELTALKQRAEAADLSLLDEGETTCCYARSDKHWLVDPQGIAWEHFQTLGHAPTFNRGEPAAQAEASPAACCPPAPATAATSAASGSMGSCAPRGKPVGIPVKGASGCC